MNILFNETCGLHILFWNMNVLFNETSGLYILFWNMNILFNKSSDLYVLFCNMNILFHITCWVIYSVLEHEWTISHCTLVYNVS